MGNIFYESTYPQISSPSVTFINEATGPGHVLLLLTTADGVGIITNMKATELLRQRIVYGENKFAELALWRLGQPMAGSRHFFKYRLAYVVNQVCVLRCDNEGGKGNHRHWGDKEGMYKFSTPAKLLADFQHDIQRWNDENSDS